MSVTAAVIQGFLQMMGVLFSSLIVTFGILIALRKNYDRIWRYMEEREEAYEPKSQNPKSPWETSSTVALTPLDTDDESEDEDEDEDGLSHHPFFTPMDGYTHHLVQKYSEESKR